MNKDEEAQLRAAIRAAKTLANQSDIPVEHLRDVRDKLLRVECRARAHGQSAIMSAAYRVRRKLRGK